MLVRNIWILGSNVTTIEGWEIERHETLVRRANARGGYLDGPDGVRIRIAKQEFPYDVGIYQNARQGMGSTFLLWLWPFASTPSSSTGLDFETNGFEDPGSSWPPPDPERIPRRRYKIADRNPFTYGADASVLDMQGFRERQYQDALRLASGRDSSLGRASFLREGSNSLRQDTDDESNNAGTAASWWDPAGEQLQDFGVDEEAEWKEEDNIPLGEMLKYRKTARLQEGLEDE
ncbi:MAG: hypothetical protein LQ352_006608 [Teloschistes flavicans]|nr:MAG: hypothetical protein LQ352_006608 [Teloschistes flavicans]